MRHQTVVLMLGLTGMACTDGPVDPTSPEPTSDTGRLQEVELVRAAMWRHPLHRDTAYLDIWLAGLSDQDPADVVSVEVDGAPRELELRGLTSIPTTDDEEEPPPCPERSATVPADVDVYLLGEVPGVRSDMGRVAFTLADGSAGGLTRLGDRVWLDTDEPTDDHAEVALRARLAVEPDEALDGSSHTIVIAETRETPRIEPAAILTLAEGEAPGEPVVATLGANLTMTFETVSDCVGSSAGTAESAPVDLRAVTIDLPAGESIGDSAALTVGFVEGAGPGFDVELDVPVAPLPAGRAPGLPATYPASLDLDGDGVIDWEAHASSRERRLWILLRPTSPAAVAIPSFVRVRLGDAATDDHEVTEVPNLRELSTSSLQDAARGTWVLVRPDLPGAPWAAARRP